ncbi:hypothetical protein NX059_009825 [Plenodomus lindquistii]|nr:hypothetical protein NX059_009825 [Plenodomus lindquistii]
MKLLTLYILIITIATLNLAFDTQNSNPINANLSLSSRHSPPEASPPDSPPGSYQDLDDAIWLRAHCRGAKLMKAMTLDEQESSSLLSWPYTQSPFDGDLKPELRAWGYLDDDTVHEQSDAQCDFDNWHHVKRAFGELGMDTRSKGMGGANHCFFVRHADGPAVLKGDDGKLPEAEEQRYNVEGKTYKAS